ncbi:hypothetical protein DFJ74DRAFT_641485 [Hyaloraphidium curvatum]|nr:hypothetical protein DFJ74DRAFT_641485 [Hyaloraphidium curvatum]
MAFAESRRGSFGRASLGSAASSAGSDVFFSPPASPAGSPTRPRSGSPLKASFAAWDPPSPENEPSDDGFDKENAENAGAGEKELPRRWRSLAKPAPPSRRTSGQPRQSLGELDVDELAREAAALTLESTGATGVVDSPARPAADDDSPVFLRRTKKRYAVVESDDEEGADPVAAIVEAYNDLPGSQEGSDAPEAAPESAASDVAFFADTIMSPNFAPLGADNRPAGCGPSSPPPRPATPSDDEPSPIIFRSTKAKRVRRTVPDDSDSDASAPPSPSLPLPSGSPSLTPPAPAPAQRSASPSPSPVFATARRSRSRRIVSDDDDDENDAPQPFETARKGDSGTSSSSASRSSPTDRLSPPPKTPSLFDRAGRASRRSAGSWEGSSSGESEESEESQEDEGSEEGSGSSDGEFEPGSEDGSASSAAEDGDEEDDSPLIVL